MEEQSEIVDISNPQSASKKSFQDDLEDDEQREGLKRPKMRDLGSVLQFGGIKRCSMVSDVSKEEGTSQFIDSVACLHSVPVQLVTSCSPLESTTNTCLSLGLVDSGKPSENLSNSGNVEPNIAKDDGAPPSRIKPDKETETHNVSSSVLNLDLNDNPLYPYKKLGQVRSADASECGSTTGPLEESEPLRLWKEMKQNGFLSSSHGRIPPPKPRGRPAKRKKEEEIKKKIDTSKREQVSKCTKLAAPTGLLSGLNPGIIKHVRNTKQVNSIIEAMLQSEKTDSEMQHSAINQFGSASRNISVHNSTGSQFSLFSNRPPLLPSFEYGGQISESNVTSTFFRETSNVSRFNPEYDGSLALKLSSAVPMASESTTTASDDGLSAGQDTIASLSLKGASVASQWLDLLQQDVKGRLAALRRSKKRVRNVIQTELPYLISKDILCNQENMDRLSQSSEGGCSSKETLDIHMTRWKSIFNQMDKALYEEGKYLENWLKQVQDMQSHCEGGLKYSGTSRTASHGEEFSGPKKTEAVEKELAIRAAAASVFSTCNLIMTKEKENVPCF